MVANVIGQVTVLEPRALLRLFDACIEMNRHNASG
jgi:hypothetical protein